MPPRARWHLRVAATRPGIREAIEAFDRFRQECGLAQGAVWQLQLALDEMLANSVSHAYAGGSEGFVDVSFRLAGGELEMTIVDDGPAFDPLLLPAPDLAAPLEERKPGGLGVHFIRSLMDRAEYARRDGRNRFVCARRVGEAGPPGPPAADGDKQEA